MTNLPKTLTIGEFYPASKESTVAALKLHISETDGRSEYEWIRLADGTLFLGFRPTGDGYFALENHMADDLDAAVRQESVSTLTGDTDFDFPELTE